DGLAAFIANVRRARFRASGGILGLNIGKSASTPIEEAASDYVACLEGVYPHADYVTVNISSPNTTNLRSLQGAQALDPLLATLQARKAELARQHGRNVPIFVKIAPDLDEAQVASIAATLTANGIDGVIATNTTLDRSTVRHLEHGAEAGGLSGAPVFERSNRVVAQLRAALGSAYPIIGVGGVMSGADACAKVAAGADMVQIYTGFVYRGPELVGEAAQMLSERRS
ncbi:MAG TPA: dihydroorotate dehydrogenase (quinone), partial [Caldimonas sp.]